MKKILILVLLLIGCEKDQENYIMSEDGTIKYIEVETITIGEESYSLYMATDPNTEDEIELTFSDNRTDYIVNDYRLQMLEPLKKYRILYNSKLYDDFELIKEEVLAIDDYIDLDFPFAVYYNEPKEDVVEIIPDELEYEVVRTINVNDKEFKLLKATPTEDKVMACYKLDEASTKYFKGIYDSNCLNEYKIRFNEVDYYAWELYNQGDITIKELNSLGYPVEKE